MNILRIAALVACIGGAGFLGAQAVASQSPPLVANCVDAAAGWKIEVLGFSCGTAGEMVRRLARTASKQPTQMKGMTCSVGFAGRAVITVRCVGERGRFLRADAYSGARSQTPRLEIARCRDHVDRTNRRWEISIENFPCADATTVVRRFADRRPVGANELKELKELETAYRTRCGFFPSQGPLRLISCNNLTSTAGKARYSGFTATVKLAATPSTNPAATTVRRRP